MTTSTESSESTLTPDPVATAEEWMNTLHDPVLPSGRKVVYRDVTLAELARFGELPEDLLQIVVAEWSQPGAAREQAMQPFLDLPKKPTEAQKAKAEEQSKTVLGRIAAVNRHLIAYAVVEPKMTAEQLEQVPYADLELLTALINRQTAHDAVGRHVGVVPLDTFHHVLEAHGVAHDPAHCQTCATLRWTLSTLRR
jgi:hypothetical protein